MPEMLPVAGGWTTASDWSCHFDIGMLETAHRLGAKTEITSVGISPGPSTSASAFTTYATPQIGQTWIDFFDLSTQRGYTKATGSHATLGPASAGKNRVATLRDWTVQLSQGVEYHHGSTVLIRDFDAGKTVVELKEAVTKPVVWSRDGIALAAGEGKGRMGVWDVRTGARVGRVVSHIDEVIHTAFMPDHKLVTLSRDGTIRITDPKTAKTVMKLEIEGTGSTNPRLLAVSPNGRSIISLWGTTMHIWLPQVNHLTSYNLNTTRTAEGWPICISDDTRWMLCRTEDGFDIVDVASGTVVWERREEGGVATMVTAASFSADNQLLLLGRMNGIVEVWDIREGSVQKRTTSAFGEPSLPSGSRDSKRGF
ncbi:hypothetical protein QQS21_000563 [Conoideocrella luteorostrata]|uniref:WD40 repeat-like protein n=1 Tax=Conoideocrella luteorostrata TaxID=1105319 RepID=A0AAJ0FZ50_9HYPO|nr:hypothetical protein QQS21_000563 [Conoideocrella luteorostrata]